MGHVGHVGHPCGYDDSLKVTGGREQNGKENWPHLLLDSCCGGDIRYSTLMEWTHLANTGLPDLGFLLG